MAAFRHGLGRFMLIFGVALTAVGGWLWRVAPPTDACHAVPLLETGFGDRVVYWDNDTLPEVAPPWQVITGWTHGWLIMRQNGSGPVYRARLDGLAPRPWLEGKRPYNSLLAWGEGGGVYFVSQDTMQVASIYHADPQGRHVTHLADLGGDGNVAGFNPNGGGLIFETGYYTVNDLTYFDTRTGQLTRITAHPNADETLLAWGPQGQRILYQVQAEVGVLSYWVVGIDGQGAQAVTLPSDFIGLWSYNPRHTLLLGLGEDAGSTVYRFDWDTLQAAPLFTIQSDDGVLVLMEADVAWVRDYAEGNGGQILSRVDLRTGEMSSTPTDIDRALAYLPAEQRVIYQTLSDPIEVKALDLTTRKTTDLLTVPLFYTVSVSPCGDSYILAHEVLRQVEIGRFDGASTSKFWRHWGTGRWLPLEAIAWRPRLMLGGGVLLIGLGGVLGWRRGQRSYRSYELDDLLTRVTDDKRHEEISTGAPVGKEGW